MANSENFYNLPEVVLRLSKSIRSCTVIDRSGNVVATENRKNLQPLTTNENRHREALQSAIRHFRTPSWARNLGKMHYNVSRYEKVIGATIPIANKYLLLVSFDYDTDSFDRIVMKKILPIVRRISESSR